MKEYPKQMESYIGKEVIVWMTDNKEEYYLGTIIRKDKGSLGHTIFKLNNKQIVFSTEVHSWDYVSNEDEYYEEILATYKFPIQNRDHINKKVIITLFNDETKKATTVRWDVDSNITIFQTEDNKFYLHNETYGWDYIKEETEETEDTDWSKLKDKEDSKKSVIITLKEYSDSFDVEEHYEEKPEEDITYISYEITLKNNNIYYVMISDREDLIDSFSLYTEDDYEYKICNKGTKYEFVICLREVLFIKRMA